MNKRATYKTGSSVYRLYVHITSTESLLTACLRPIRFSLHYWYLTVFLTHRYPRVSLLLFPILHFPLSHFQRPLLRTGPTEGLSSWRLSNRSSSNIWHRQHSVRLCRSKLRCGQTISLDAAARLRFEITVASRHFQQTLV